MTRLLLTNLICLFIGSNLSSSVTQHPQFIVWNTGQGLWTTLVNHESCTHFDTGGEQVPMQSIAHLCASKRNEFYFSHWDWDHVGQIRMAQSRLKNSCLQAAPGGSPKPSKRKLLATLTDCRFRNPIAREIGQSLRKSLKPKRNESNAHSRVYIAYKSILLPGDAGQKEERQWLEQLNAVKIRWLVLGHHGSRTSTSKQLLRKVRNLKGAIASARQRKYGHPHQQVLDRLVEERVPLLRTEEWGSIRIELPAND